VIELLATLAALLGVAMPGATSTGTAEPSARTVRLTIAASGDLLVHTPIAQRALALGGGRRYDFAPLFAPVRRVIAGADLALCHMETPLVPGSVQGYPVFHTPPDLARSIKRVGWDASSTASNHSLDAGQAGIGSTLHALRRAGVKATGTSRSARARRRVAMLRAKGVRIALLSYTAVTNGQAVPHPWSVNWASPGPILRDARRARRRGARIVIVNIHWGTEFAAAVSPQQRALARRLTRSPAIDAIVGQHVHVVQPIRRVHGKPVVFGEGNLISNQTAGCCPAASQDGLIALIDFVRAPGGSGTCPPGCATPTTPLCAPRRAPRPGTAR
jgi:poly-gamma-glutamate capsule biosynthesis protein CapA/YwtB (metallophosphatase superfamily)